CRIPSRPLGALASAPDSRWMRRSVRGSRGAGCTGARMSSGGVTSATGNNTTCSSSSASLGTSNTGRSRARAADSGVPNPPSLTLPVVQSAPYLTVSPPRSGRRVGSQLGMRCLRRNLNQASAPASDAQQHEPSKRERQRQVDQPATQLMARKHEGKGDPTMPRNGEIAEVPQRLESLRHRAHLAMELRTQRACSRHDARGTRYGYGAQSLRVRNERTREVSGEIAG